MRRLALKKRGQQDQPSGRAPAPSLLNPASTSAANFRLSSPEPAASASPARAHAQNWAICPARSSEIFPSRKPPSINGTSPAAALSLFSLFSAIPLPARLRLKT